MKLVTSILFISYLLDGIVSNYTLNINWLLPCLSLMTLIVIYPYFNGNINKYIKYTIIFGLLFDIAYSDVYLLNTTLFTLSSILIYMLNKVLTNNSYNIVVMGLITILFYRSLSYIIFIMFNEQSFIIDNLLQSIYNSIVLNIIYLLFLTIITDKISKEYKIPKIY